MALVRWSPFSELADMRREMQSLASLMNQRFVPFGGEDRFIPAMDVNTRGEDLVIKLEIPAVDIEKDVEISVEQGMLRISGKRTEERAEDKEGYYLREMRYGTFQRTFPLPEPLEADAVKAEYRDGVLEVTVAGGAKQMARPEAQHIQITRGSGGQQQPASQQQVASQSAGAQSESAQGAAPDSWAPADSGTSSASGSSGQAGQEQPQVTPD